jgi:hypothetical protein
MRLDKGEFIDEGAFSEDAGFKNLAKPLRNCVTL